MVGEYKSEYLNQYFVDDHAPDYMVEFLKGTRDIDVMLKVIKDLDVQVHALETLLEESEKAYAEITGRMI